MVRASVTRLRRLLRVIYRLHELHKAAVMRAALIKCCCAAEIQVLRWTGAARLAAGRGAAAVRGAEQSGALAASLRLQ